MVLDNTFEITRFLAGHTVQIVAHYIARLELYGVKVLVDGIVWDMTQSDDVLGDAGKIFTEVYTELD